MAELTPCEVCAPDINPHCPLCDGEGTNPVWAQPKATRQQLSDDTVIKWAWTCIASGADVGLSADQMINILKPQNIRLIAAMSRRPREVKK